MLPACFHRSVKSTGKGLNKNQNTKKDNLKKEIKHNTHKIFHILCNRLTIQYLIQRTAHVTINNYSLFCDAPTMFWLPQATYREIIYVEIYF